MKTLKEQIKAFNKKQAGLLAGDILETMDESTRQLKASDPGCRPAWCNHAGIQQ